MIGICFPLLADTTDWTEWFTWAKRYSVVFPTIAYAFANWRIETRSIGWLAFFSIVLLLNTAEAGVADLQTGHFNGILILIVAALTPCVGFNRHIIGFNNYSWIIAHTFTLIQFYIFNYLFFENATFPGILVLLLAIMGSLQFGANYWLVFRAYTLYFIILFDSFFPSFSNDLYPDFLHSNHRKILSESSIEYISLTIGATLVALLVIKQYKKFSRNENDTFLAKVTGLEKTKK